MCVFFNLYNYTFHCCNFSPYIPIEVSVRVFDWIVFCEDEDNPLVYLICFMLKILEDEILEITDPDMFYQYFTKAEFIERCFTNPVLFDQIMQYWRNEFENIMAQE